MKKRVNLHWDMMKKLHEQGTGIVLDWRKCSVEDWGRRKFIYTLRAIDYCTRVGEIRQFTDTLPIYVLTNEFKDYEEHLSTSNRIHDDSFSQAKKGNNALYSKGML